MKDFFSCGFLVLVGIPLALIAGAEFMVETLWGRALTGISFGLASALIADLIWEVFFE